MTTGPGGELRRLRALVDDVHAVVWEAETAGGSFTFVSEGARELLGYPGQAFVDEPSLWADRLHPEDRDAAVKEFLLGIEGAHAHDLDYRFLHGDGSVVWIRDIGHTVCDVDGRPVVMRGLMIDVTRYKLAELELQAERETAAELRTLDEMKNTFLAAVSHDLRTPLAAILGLALTLEQQTLEPDEAQDFAARIAANARRLDRMVTDLLDLDRLSRGIVAPVLQPMDVAVVAEMTVAESELRGREVAVETEKTVAWVDAGKVERIVENLLANAIRHTPATARIWVRVVPDRDGALIAVDDEGGGIPSAKREEIFLPFRQASEFGDPAGVGIGLALVARFAELHGGRAWVEDRVGGGASFRVWLPARPAEAEPDQARTTTSS